MHSTHKRDGAATPDSSGVDAMVGGTEKLLQVRPPSPLPILAGLTACDTEDPDKPDPELSAETVHS